MNPIAVGNRFSVQNNFRNTAANHKIAGINFDILIANRCELQSKKWKAHRFGGGRVNTGGVFNPSAGSGFWSKFKVNILYILGVSAKFNRDFTLHFDQNGGGSKTPVFLDPPAVRDAFLIW